MCSVLPVDFVRIDQPQECLVHEFRRLQRVARPLPPYETESDTVQLGLDDRDQLVESRRLSVSPRD
jgi:hypothetical protein